MVPYPVIRGDYWANVGFWWDLEFWNKSVEHEAGRAERVLRHTRPAASRSSTLRFDPRTGRANVDRRAYVAQASATSRFHIAGALATQREVST